ncbi:MAG: prepilin peptidase dependent protein B [Paraglaciecola sp.]|nr:prepilin peptidase dependent protein B [Paraglaciecola sp.]
MLTVYHRQVGTSLVELMISMTLGLASLTAMASLIGHGIALNSQLLAKSRLDGEINGILTIVAHDVQRAGYHAWTENMLNNPGTFSSAFYGQPIRLSEYPFETPDSCITFAYDRNHNGLLDTVNTNEKYGYRLKNKAIEIRQGGFSCIANGWQDLSDPNVVSITDLSFSKEVLSNQPLTHVRIHLFLTANLVKHPELSRGVRTSFTIKNYE